jgi:hypothetical protein
MKPNIATVLLASAVVLCAQRQMAQPYSIDWHTISGGGGAGTGGAFALSGTIGQPDTSQQPITGGNFSLAGGFWSLFAVQTPGAPLLSIERLGAEVRVFWPLPAAGFVLDQSLTVTGAWSQVSFPYMTNSTGISIGAPAPTGNKFYRLRKL